MEDAGFTTHLDARRGFDHGTFAPLAVMYPNADVPLLDLSMRQDYEPSDHIGIGRALEPLRDQGVLIIGSGLSYHNRRNFGPAARETSAAFDRWLQQTLVDCSLGERNARRLEWETAPAARSTQHASAGRPSAASHGGGGGRRHGQGRLRLPPGRFLRRHHRVQLHVRRQLTVPSALKEWGSSCPPPCTHPVCARSNARPARARSAAPGLRRAAA